MFWNIVKSKINQCVSKQGIIQMVNAEKIVKYPRFFNENVGLKNQKVLLPARKPRR
jgi:hypothetical protein